MWYLIGETMAVNLEYVSIYKHYTIPELKKSKRLLEEFINNNNSPSKAASIQNAETRLEVITWLLKAGEYND